MNDFYEMLAAGQLFGGSLGTHLLSVAMLVGLFAVLMFRREAIANTGMFKVSWFLFATSVAAPFVLMPLVTFNDPFSGSSAADDSVFLRLVSIAAGPGCLALSMYTFIISMFPRLVPELPTSVPSDQPTA